MKGKELIKKERFCLKFLDAPHSTQNETFGGGDWFILESSLPVISKRISISEDIRSPIKKSFQKAKICIYCRPTTLGNLTYEVARLDQHYEEYIERKSIFILPDNKFDKLNIHYFELKFPFSANKEKEIRRTIEKDSPSTLEKKGAYYKAQSDCLDFLRRGNLKTNGHFITCSTHSTEKYLGDILQRIAESSLELNKHEFGFYPYLGNDVLYHPVKLEDFLSQHYKVDELKTKIISTRSLEESIGKQVNTYGFF